MGRWVCTAGVLLLWAGSAVADGAFPDSIALFLPADRPGEIVLGTNFGLVISEDDGASWHLMCEQVIASYVARYQMSAPPADTLYAETPIGLAASRDHGCSWSFAGGRLAGATVIDSFPDPSDANGLFAIARSSDDGGESNDALYRSHDGGRSFPDAPLYSAGAAVSLTGVENARSSPQTLYLTMFSYPPLTPLVARSDGGGPFALVDESAYVSDQLYLAAVDPLDARVLYFRVRGQGEAFAVSRDGGASLGLVRPLTGRMSAFLRRANGTILIGTTSTDSLRSTDGGLSFQPWPKAPHVRALGERNGVVYVAAGDISDGFAVARSSDEGAHWTPLLHFRDIIGPLPCGNVPATCAGALASVMGLFNPGDGGVVPDADPAVPPAAPPSRSSGCGCAVAGAAPAPWPAIMAAGLALVLGGLVRARSKSEKRGRFRPIEMAFQRLRIRRQ